MAAIVSDQFRLLNAKNFVDSVLDSNNSYYAFLGLANAGSGVADPSNGFGRSSNWDTDTPVPTDNLQYFSQYKDTALFGKRINSANIRRLIRKVDWTVNTSYDMYRHDYSLANPSPNSNSSRLYDSNYYVINSDYRVYICIDNGSSGTNLRGNRSQDEPTFTDSEPSAAGVSGDGYVWKYLFSVSPSDVIKFDSTDYIVVPNNWETTTDTDITTIREAGDSTVNFNQIRKIYVEDGGAGYTSGVVDILGDGSGARALINVNSSGTITSATITSGGSGYTYGIVDLGPLQPSGSLPNPAKLIPIIPPSRGHGYDIYTELGTDRVLVYARFDDSTKNFPVDTKFSQIGIIKNPKVFGSVSTNFTENDFSSLFAIKLISSFSGTPVVGEKITQTRDNGNIAKGYVASYDSETKVLKYFRDRSLYFGNESDQTDYNSVTEGSTIYDFESSTQNINFVYSGGVASIDTTFDSNKVTVGNKQINLGVTFTGGLANPQINRKTGDIIYINNRPTVERNLRQKEDIKIVLEF